MATSGLPDSVENTSTGPLKLSWIQEAPVYL